jgi:hypothetical protein
MNFYKKKQTVLFYGRLGKHCLLIVSFMLASISVVIAQNCGCDHYITLADVTNQSAKIIEWDGGPTKKNVQPGQTICFQSITYLYTIRLSNIKGTANARITIKNCGGQTVIDNKNNGTGNTGYGALTIAGSEYFILAGDGDPSVPYGIKIAASNNHGISIGGFSTDYEVKNVEIGYTDGTGFNCKTDPNCDNRDLRWFVQKNSIFHDNLIHHTHKEGMYVGYTNFPSYRVPAGSKQNSECVGAMLYGHSLENTKIYRNIVRDIEWDAIQLNATVKGGEIYENTVINYGTVNQGTHNNAIQLSNATVSKVYNNYILPSSAGAQSGPGHGIVYWGASTKIFNNVIVNAGGSNYETIQVYNYSHPDSSVHILNNTIISKGKAAISIFSSSSTPFRVQNNILIHPTGQYIPDEPSQTIETNNFKSTSEAAAKFADDEYHLQSNSPCIDAGTNLYAYNVKFDIDRDARPASGSFDIGADEYGANPTPPGTCQASGSILQEIYSDIIGSTVADLTSAPSYPDNPTSTALLTSFFETNSNYADHYGQRVRGYICPPTTGTYYFYLSGNDDAELWLSTNDSPASKAKIIDLPGATNVREWTKYPAQKSAGISLVAGQRYYIEALHKEGTNSDNLAVGWELPGGTLERPIPASRLSPASTAPPTCTASGTITREQYNNIIGEQVADLTSDPDFPDNPDVSVEETLFEAPSNIADHYGTRMSGYLCAPITGAYKFFISGNDRCELWLSTDSDPLNKVLIARVTSATNSREWEKSAEQQSAAISLVAGQRYYIEALHKEGTNSDHLAVGWQLPDLTFERPIPGTRLSPAAEASAAKASSAQIISLGAKEEEVTVYPNPASNVFHVAVPAGNGCYKLKLVDLNGRVWKERLACEGSVEINDVPAGLYVVTIDNGIVVTRKKLKIITK